MQSQDGFPTSSLFQIYDYLDVSSEVFSDMISQK